MVNKTRTQLQSRRASEIDKIIGERLRARRRLLSLSQEQLALHCSISAQQIHKYEVNQSRISVGRLAQFADVLGVPVTWFFDGLGDHDDFSDDVIDLLANPDYVELFLLLEQVGSTRYTEGLLAMVRRHAADQDDVQTPVREIQLGKRAQ